MMAPRDIGVALKSRIDIILEDFGQPTFVPVFASCVASTPDLEMFSEWKTKRV